MNLLIVVPGGVDQSGEVNVIPVLLNLFKQLSAEHRVVIVALNQHTKLTEYSLCNCQVISLATVKTRNLLTAFNTLTKRLQHHDFKADMVHSFWLGKPTLLGAMVARKYRTRLLASIGGGELINMPDIGYGGSQSWISRMMNRLSLRLADDLTCGSQFLQSMISAQRNLSTQLIPLGLDTHFWRLQPCNQAPRDDEKWRLIVVASINQVKDPWLLLDIVAELKQADFNFMLNWVGEDTLHGKVQHRAEVMGLGEWIQFHGFKTQSQLKEMLSTQHFIVQTSHFESQGVAMAEASSQGVCPVGTNVGWLSDMDHGVALTKDVLACEIATRIIALAGDNHARQLVVEKAQQWIIENNVQQTVERFEGCYLN